MPDLPPQVNQGFLRSRLWEPAVNTTGEEIPACAVVRVSCQDSNGFWQIGKATADSQASLAVNHWSPIPANGVGQISFRFPNYAAYSADSAGYSGDDSYAVPACGDIWGAQAGSWYLHDDQIGFRVLSDPVSVGVVDAEGSETGTVGLQAVMVTIDLGDPVDVDVVEDICFLPVSDDSSGSSGVA